MSSDPEAIRAQIEVTRADLSADVNELGDKVSPSQIVKRQGDRVKNAATSVKDRVLGSADDVTSAGGDAMSAVGDAVSDAPGKVARKAQGSPVAAGLIAFGTGMLLAGLFPASRQEAKVAAAVKEQAQPLMEEATSTAKEIAGNLQEPAQQALDSVKSTASDAVDNVKEAGASAAEDVKDQAVSAKDTVQEQASSS
jgi:gas vesicle protein